MNTDKNAGLGAVIKALREQRRMSQALLADFAGLHRISIARFEAGTQPMKIDTLVAIAGALGCTVKIELVPGMIERGAAASPISHQTGRPQ